MKNALKLYLAVIIGLGAASVVPAIAQVMGDAAVAVATSAQNQAAIQNQAAETQMPPISPPAAAESTAVPTAEATPAVEPPQIAGVPPEGDMLGDDKIPASVKNVVERLDTKTEDTTLEDLNAAREAVAKLDVLIDIEKRLTDLADIRQKRDQSSMLGGAIPASAFGIAGQGQPMAAAPPPPLTLSEADVEIVRIVGASSRRTAHIKSNGDEKVMQVHEGDKLSDDSVVAEISSRSITLLRDGKKRTVKIKDVGTIFTGR